MNTTSKTRTLWPFSSKTILPQEKKSLPPLFAMGQASTANWTPRGFSTLVSAGYHKNAIVYRCVRLIAQTTANTHWLHYHGTQEADQSPLINLLKHPNAGQSGLEFMETLVSHLLLSGNAYIQKLGDRHEPIALYTLRPDRMSVTLNQKGWPTGYQYTLGDQKKRFPITEDGLCDVLHICNFHPTDDHYGFPPLMAAQKAIDIHNAAAEWNKALLDNAARPSGALVYAPNIGGNLTEDQYERLKSELETSFQGAHNAGRPLLLEGGLDWKSLSFSPKDMDFMQAKNAAAREIALAFGVPPMLLGIPGDNTYANYVEANKAFWRQTVQPILHTLSQKLTGWLCGEDETLWFDEDKVDALNTDRETLWKRVNNAAFLSDEEKREMLGFSREKA